VNGVPGGTSSWGTVAAGAGDHLATYLQRSELLVSNITVVDEWTGTSSVDYMVFRIDTNVTWRYVATVGTRSSFEPEGTVTVTSLDPCLEFTPGSMPIGTFAGVLTIDTATDPPRARAVTILYNIPLSGPVAARLAFPPGGTGRCPPLFAR
jgi:hypothetical protein